MPYEVDEPKTNESEKLIVINYRDGESVQHAVSVSKAHRDLKTENAVKFGWLVCNALNDVLVRLGVEKPAFPNNPVARSLGDLVTAKQLGMIRALARESGVDAEEECFDQMSCETDELSKRAASAFIQHLQTIGQQNANFEP